MSLPESRNQTCTPTSPVSSQLSNDLQDCIIGGWHGPRTMNLSPNGGNGTMLQAAERIVAAGVGQHWLWALPLHAGDRVQSIAWGYVPNGGGGPGTLATFALVRRTFAGPAASDSVVGSVLGVGFDPDSQYKVATLTLAGAGYVLLPTDDYFLRILSGGASDHFMTCHVTYDRPRP